MHELSMMRDLIEQVKELSFKEKFNQVFEIKLAVGRLSGIEPSCLEFCFPEATQDSLLSGAKLILESVGVELVCNICHHISHPSYPNEPISLNCMKCQSMDVRVSKGKEFRIAEMEVN